MKVGISYNVFDAEEHLRGSISQIRNSVDYISIVFQKKSNYGQDCNKNLEEYLNKLKKDGLVNDIIEYHPIFGVSPHVNEVNKRNIGLMFSEKNGCTHHMSMDTDEYYLKEEFEYMKKIILDGDYDSSACQMSTYYKEPIYRLEPKEEYYVSLLFRIRPNITYTFGNNLPVLTDPTRSMNQGKFKRFERGEIEMHHMSFIRLDIEKKLRNSSAKINFESFIPEFLNYFNSWEYGMKAKTVGNPPIEYDIIKVNNIFNINLYEN
jgi:hypothetical protein